MHFANGTGTSDARPVRLPAARPVRRFIRLGARHASYGRMGATSPADLKGPGDMTMMSFWVSHYPRELTREQLETFALDLERLALRPTLEGRTGPDDLSVWAKAEGLPEFYVDNCWIRVPASGTQLRAFFKARAVADQKTGPWEAAIDDEARYLLQAEEF